MVTSPTEANFCVSRLPSACLFTTRLVAFLYQFGDDADLWIGPDLTPLEELEQDLSRIRDELLEVYNREDYEGLDMEHEQVRRLDELERQRDELLERLYREGSKLPPGA